MNDREPGTHSPDADHISELSLPRENLARAGAQMGRAGTTTTNTRRSLVDGEDSGVPVVEEEDHIPGRDGPIGFLAAMGELNRFYKFLRAGRFFKGVANDLFFFLCKKGTPYAKKPIWKSKKAGILCATFGLITLIVRR